MDISYLNMNTENYNACLFDITMVTMKVRVMLKVIKMTINKSYTNTISEKKNSNNLNIYMALHFTMTRQYWKTSTSTFFP